jgi:transposase
LSREQIEDLKKILEGKVLAEVQDIIQNIECKDTIPSGHVEAVLTTMNRIGMDYILKDVTEDEKNIIKGLVAAIILEPKIKHYTCDWWKTNSLSKELSLEEVTDNHIYKAMDKLLPLQSDIENLLARCHLSEGDMIFLDVSSSYYEGTKSSLIQNIGNESEDSDGYESELIRFGYSRDRKRNKAQINYSLITDKDGQPISIQVFPGNTSVAKIFLPTVDKIIQDFGISRAVMVGDRGMLSSKDITILQNAEGIDWITALRSSSIKTLVAEGVFNVGLFDDKNICEFTAPNDYAGERLISCHNPVLKARREAKRNNLISATANSLNKIKSRVKTGRLKKKGCHSTSSWKSHR